MHNEYLFVLDALRSDHLKYMPWLNKKKQEGIFVENFKSSPGFCERSELFLGQNSSELGFYTAHTINDYASFNFPFFWMPSFLGKCLSIFERNKLLSKVIRFIIWKLSILFCKYPMHPQNIPLEILKYISLTEDSLDFKVVSKLLRSGLIYKFENQGFVFVWNLFTSLTDSKNLDDHERLKLLENYKLKTNYFIPIYISLPDKLGHCHGPHSTEMVAGLNALDESLRDSYNDIINHNPHSVITFIGDHGMDLVTNGLDIDKLLKNTEHTTNVSRFKDYYFFLDSTILRIWWKSSDIEKKNVFMEELNKNDILNANGYFIDNPVFKNSIKIYSSKSPDLIWWAKKGNQICPDFFHSSPNHIRGMHGYLERDNPSHGFVIRLKKGINNNNILKMSGSEIDSLF